MRTFITIVFVGILIAVGVIWFESDKNPHADEAKSSIQNAVHETGAMIKDKLDSWNLKPDTIKDEMARSGKVIRTKAQEAGHAIADATADARITTAIKAKLLGDQHLASLSISVNTSNGLVTLSGTATSAENISQAIQIAMDTDGVIQVISTLQVKS